jgi:N-acetylmuramoyl-L-alanine amidase
MWYKVYNKNFLSFIMGCLFLSFGINPMLFANKSTHAAVDGIRVWAAPESTRLVFDLSQGVKYKIFSLDNPHRVVIDIHDAKFQANLDQISLMDSRITQIRHSMKNGTLRIVLDMEEQVKPSGFLLNPNRAYGDRLVVDLTHPVVPKYNRPALKAQTKGQSKSSSAVVDLKHFSSRELIVAIDPGHGGDDTGAVGKNKRLREKDVVFEVSKKLEALVNAQPRMRAFLIRNGDYYVGLRRRMELAREEGADLFISVHADSFTDPRASGASVFVLSEKGASNEAARWLAERENSSDLAGGVKLENKGHVLKSVLLDLSQTASQSASHDLAHHLVKNLMKVTDLHHKGVQKAGFMVLKSPDIPSVLVELGFISNRKGEEKLYSTSHQQALAHALLSGIKAYAAKRPAPISSPRDFNIAHKRRGRSKEEG